MTQNHTSNFGGDEYANDDVDAKLLVCPCFGTLKKGDERVTDNG
jgi:hypothetical protein